MLAGPGVGAQSTGWDADVRRPVAWWETWTGAEATQQSWSLYSGLTIAPFGDIRKPGVRLRSVAGYGRYRYRGNLLINQKVEPTVFRGVVSFAEVLAGYQFSWGPLTTKLFAGYYMEVRNVLPRDPLSRSQGRTEGVKLALENWLDFGSHWWASLDGSWTSANSSYWSRVRLAYRLWPKLSVGLEAGALGNIEFDAVRAGVLLRYELSNGEVSASGGITGDSAASTNPYAGIVWLQKF